jgi:four helix bundle protein
MNQISKTKQYDLEGRTFKFAKNIRIFLKSIKNSIESMEDKTQLMRSSGSVGANYIEANESMSSKDFVHRIKICRKESKESRYWLELLEVDETLEEERQKLIQESTELMNIFGAIIRKIEK